MHRRPCRIEQHPGSRREWSGEIEKETLARCRFEPVHVGRACWLEPSGYLGPGSDGASREQPEAEIPNLTSLYEDSMPPCLSQSQHQVRRKAESIDIGGDAARAYEPELQVISVCAELVKHQPLPGCAVELVHLDLTGDVDPAENVCPDRGGGRVVPEVEQAEGEVARN
jgi:hypothetical protein